MTDTHFPDEWLAHSLEGVVTPELLAELREKTAPPARLWETLVAQKIASDEQILTALSTRFRLKLADLAQADPAAKERVPEQVARRYHILPLRATDSYLEVATANPFDLDAEKALAFATAREIRMFLLAPSKIAERLDEMYRPEKAVDKLLEGMGSSAELVQLQDSLAPDEITIAASEAEASQRPVVRLVDLIISEGILARSSDIHIEPEEGGVAVRYRIDGVLRQVMKIPRQAGLPLISRIKIMSSLDIADRLRPQDGRARVAVNGQPIDLRVSTLPAALGEKVVIRILDSRATVKSLDSLGLNTNETEGIKRLLENHEGIILVTGPTGSGKTTTLYSCINQIKSEGVNIGPGGIPDAGDRAGAGAGEGRPDVRLGAALDPAPGPERGADRRDPGSRNGTDRRAGIAHRALGALDAAHERRGERRHAPRRHRGRSLQDRRRAARRRGAAADAQAVPHLQGSVDGGARRPPQEVGPEGDAVVSRGRLSRLRHDGIPRPFRDHRGPDGVGRGGAAHRGGRDGGAYRGGLGPGARAARRIHARRINARGRHPGGGRPSAGSAGRGASLDG